MKKVNTHVTANTNIKYATEHAPKHATNAIKHIMQPMLGRQNQCQAGGRNQGERAGQTHAGGQAKAGGTNGGGRAEPMAAAAGWNQCGRAGRTDASV